MDCIFMGSFIFYFAAYLEAPSILNYVFGIDLVRGGEIGFELMIGGIIFAVVASIISTDLWVFLK